VLVTAAEQSVATRIADFLALFDSVIASDGTINLKGTKKRDVLLRRFGRGGFDYIGNSLTDIPIFEQAATAMYGGHSFMLRVGLALISASRVSTINEQSSLLADSGLLPLFRTFRPKLWTAALLVFLPIATSRHAFNAGQLNDAILAALSFVLTTSSACLVGDLFDLESDRKDPDKRNGPVASGSLSLVAAIHSVWISAVAGVLIALLVNKIVFATVAMYYVIALLHSTFLKRCRIADLTALAILYIMLVFAGEAALRVRIQLGLMLMPALPIAALTFIKRSCHFSRKTNPREHVS
jgi:hypothetical protein